MSRQFCLYCARDFADAAQQAKKTFGDALVVKDYLYCVGVWIGLAKSYRSVRRHLPR